MLDRADTAGRCAEAARRLEIFLDVVAMFATSSAAHLLDPTFDGVLTADERAVRDALRDLGKRVTPAARRSVAWSRVEAFLQGLGGEPER
jgi:hypothetical protein